MATLRHRGQRPATAVSGAGNKSQGPWLIPRRGDTAPLPPAILPPSNVVPPSITGDTTQSGVLTLDVGTWTGTEPITFTQQWKRNGADVLGSTEMTYAKSSADDGADIRCVVTAVNQKWGQSAVSNTITIDSDAPWTHVLTVGINASFAGFLGGVQLGDLDPLQLDGKDVLYLSATITAPFVRMAFVDGTGPRDRYLILIEGFGELDLAWDAAENRYTMQENLGLFEWLEARVDQSVNMTIEGADAIPMPVPPFNTVAPSITGDTTTTGDLVCSPGTWEGDPTITFAFQWQSNNGDIPGETSDTYSKSEADAGLPFICRVTAANGAGSEFALSDTVILDAGQVWTHVMTPGVNGGYAGFQKLTSTGLLDPEQIDGADIEYLSGNSTAPFVRLRMYGNTPSVTGYSFTIEGHNSEVPYDLGPVSSERYTSPVDAGLYDFFASRSGIPTNVALVDKDSPPAPPVIPGDYPPLTRSAVADAAGRDLTYYVRTTSGAFGGSGCNNAFWGPASITLGLDRWLGNSDYEARLLAQIAKVLVGGNEPNSCGNYTCQHESYVIAMLLGAKKTPEIWAQLTADQKSRADCIMRTAGFGGAYMSSKLFVADSPPLDGSANAYRQGYNPNHSLPKPLTVMMAALYFGEQTYHDMLRNYTWADEIAALNSFGFTNAHYAWNLHKGVTVAQLENIIRCGAKGNATGWECWYGPNVFEWRDLLEYEIYDRNFAYNVVRGIGSGDKGITIDGKQWGTMITTAQNEASVIANMPYPLGTKGGGFEFDSGDASGDRSSMQYVLGGSRPATAALIAAIMSGEWDVNSAQAQKIMDRYVVGFSDVYYKQAVCGYRDYANGKAVREWPPAPDKSEFTTFGGNYTFDLAAWVAEAHGRALIGVPR